MKGYRRILCFSLLLFAVIHLASGKDFTQCGLFQTQCRFHESCLKLSPPEKFVPYTYDDKNLYSCENYIIVKGVDDKTIQMEMRITKMDKGPAITKNTGAVISKEGKSLLTCKADKIIVEKDWTKTVTAKMMPDDSDDVDRGPGVVRCRFTLSLKKESPRGIYAEMSKKSFLWQFAGIKVEDFKFMEIIPCNWATKLFTETMEHDQRQEESFNLVDISWQEKECKGGDLWYKVHGPGNDWFRIDNKFSCQAGVIKMRRYESQVLEEAQIDRGRYKCVLTKCAMCKCSFCDVDINAPKFIEPVEGKSCAGFECKTGSLQVEPPAGKKEFVQENRIDCSADSSTQEMRWKGVYPKIAGAKCIATISCVKLHPVFTECPTHLPRKEICSEAVFDDYSARMCTDIDAELKYVGSNKLEHSLSELKCNLNTGEWIAKEMDGSKLFVEQDANFYCLKGTKTVKKKEEGKNKTTLAKEKVAEGGALDGGMIALIILGVVILAAGVIFLIACLCKRHITKKTDREAIKSVSITGKSRRKRKGIKSHRDTKSTDFIMTALPSTISGTSVSRQSSKSEPSAPSNSAPVRPPPPPPPSFSYDKVEPIPPPPAHPTSVSRGNKKAAPPPPPARPGAEAKTPIGPDTGKPDRPAELVDMMTSELKRDDTSRKVNDSPSATGQQSDATVTGSLADKSNVELIPKDESTTRKGESMKSKTEKRPTVDKKGRGLTDDEDYDIKEGEKPVNHVDKNKKTYQPPVNNKFVAVTVTEDDPHDMLKKRST